MTGTKEQAGRGRVWLRRVGIVVAVLAALRLIAPWAAETYARGFIVEDELLPSDAVVVLAGGNGERLHAGIQLYKRHLARELFIVGPDVPMIPVYTGEDSLTQAEAKRRIALKRGVPADSIVFQLGPTSTFEEAEVAARVAKEQGWRSLIVVTSPFHTRRARATFHRAFHGMDTKIRVYHLPIGKSSDNPERWWRREGDTMAVATETIKTVFYGWNHGVWPWT